MGERVLSKDFVRSVTDSLGVAPLKPAAAESLAQDVEYRLREVIAEALKFMKHSRRSTLWTSDVDAALRVRNVEPLYGFNSLAPLKFRPLSEGGAAGDAFTLEDDVVDIEALLNAPLPKVPLDLTFSAHWLAIEGVQPAIPQNPAPAQGRDPAGNALDAASTAEPVQSVTGTATESRPTVKHVLSKEVQLYYEKMTTALLSESLELREIAWAGMREDAGLHQLAPYLVQFVQTEITRQLLDLRVTGSMLCAIESLVDNENLFIEPYLHQLMPSLITCIIAKRLTRNASETGDALRLRDKAAGLAARVVRDFGDLYPTLRPRVTRTLMRALLDFSLPAGTHYGAIRGLSLLGNEVRKIVLVPNARLFMDLVAAREREQAKMSDDSGAASAEPVASSEEELTACREAYMDGVADLYASMHGDVRESESFADMAAVFGEEALTRRIESRRDRPDVSLNMD